MERLKRMYKDGVSIVVVNYVEGRKIENKRLLLRQGDRPSMFFFAYGIVPIIDYLHKRLKGIELYSHPVEGPLPELSDLQAKLPTLTESYKVISYVDDLKPAVSSLKDLELNTN